HEFGLVDQAIGPHHVHVTLIKLTVAPSLWPVGAPYGLYLEPLERQGKLMLVHYHVTGARNRKVVASRAVGDRRNQWCGGTRFPQLRRCLGEVIARVQYLKD